MYPGDGWERELLTAEKLHQHVLTQVLPDTREVLFLLRYYQTLGRFCSYSGITRHWGGFVLTQVFPNTREVFFIYSSIP